MLDQEPRRPYDRTQLVQRHLLSKILSLLLTTGSLLLSVGCSRENSVTPATNEFRPRSHERSDGAQQNSTLVVSNYAATLPKISGPAGYVGSRECRSCHEEQFESWHRSYHRTMTQIITTNSIQADFN